MLVRIRGELFDKLKNLPIKPSNHSVGTKRTKHTDEPGNPIEFFLTGCIPYSAAASIPVKDFLCDPTHWNSFLEHHSSFDDPEVMGDP